LPRHGQHAPARDADLDRPGPARVRERRDRGEGNRGIDLGGGEMARTKKILMPKGALMKKAQWSGTRGSYLTHIPEIAVKTIEEIEVTAIREPYAYGRVIYDHDKSEYLYEVWEPQLDDKEQKLLSLLKDSLNRTLEYEWD